MKIEKVIELTPYKRFIYWISERHKIFLKRNAGVRRPWTDDQILQNYFFTNPYRENDKVTQWFREKIRDPLKNKDEVMFATVLFRWFNFIPTGERIVAAGLHTNWNTDRAVKLLTGVQNSGGKVFTGAFTISPSGSTLPKIQRVCQDYVAPVWKSRIKICEALHECHTMEEVFMVLSQYPGLAGGGFMAYEIVCDLRYTKFLNRATDTHTWTNLGPGGIRGLNRVLGRDVDAPKPKDWQEQMVKLLAKVTKSLPNMPPFEMREMEHSLCEVDKMERALFNQGHMKRRYQGT